MSKLLAGVCLLLLLALCASGTVLNFENLSGQAVLAANYAGLTWSDGWEYYDWAQDPYNPSSGNVRLYNNSGSAPPRIWFATPTVFNGAYFSGESSAQFELYLNNGLVATSGTIGLSGTPALLTSNYAGLVDEVHLIVTQGRFVMDDLTFDGTQGAVPEPGSGLLLGAGLLAVWWLRKR